MSGDDFIVGLDIGTTKIFTVVAKPTTGGDLKILGAGSSPTRGMRRGVVTSIKEVGEAIRHSVCEAELSAGVSIREVYAGISGEHVRSHNVRGSIVISRAGDEVEKRDVRKVIQDARGRLDGIDRKILHISPQQFILDSQRGIRDPVGMRGVHLEAEVHVVSGSVQNSSNLLSGIEEANIKLIEFVLEPLAESYCLFSEEEGEMGTLLIDIGGHITNVAVFSSGGIRHSFVLPVGGNNVTQDIAIGLRTSMETAELIKVRHGTCMKDRVEPGETFFLPDEAGERKEVDRSRLCTIVQARMEETFEIILTSLHKEGLLENLTAGVVLAGGGNLLDCADSLAEKIFDLPVRIGTPGGVVGISHGFSDCRFSTGIGLVLYARRNAGNEYAFSENGKGLLREMTGRMKEFFSDFI
ncbi:MAG: cell division protein FtsA [Candidatus Glassbacteria bacterium]